MEDLQTGVDELSGVPPTSNDLGDDFEGTPPSDLDEDLSGTSPDKEGEGLKEALLAERKKRQDYEYQLGNLRNELQDLRTKVDKPATTDIDTHLMGLSIDELQDLYDGSVDVESPNYEQLKPHRKSISKAIRDRQVNETVSSLEIKNQKREADMRAFNAYPDIGDSQSEIFRAAQQVMAEYAPELKRAGANIDRMPRFLEICVNEAANRLKIEAKTNFQKGQNTEYNRQMAANKAGIDTGKKKTTGKEPEVTAEQARISKMMGVDPKAVAARKKNLQDSGLFKRVE